MVDMFASMGEVGGGADSRKALEIMDEMGLIEVAAIQRDLRPIDFLSVAEGVQNLLKTQDPAKQFRRQSDGFIKNLDEPPGAVTCLINHLGNGF